MRSFRSLAIAGVLLALLASTASATTYHAKSIIQRGNGSCGNRGTYPTAGSISFARTGNLVSFSWKMGKAQKSALIIYSLWINECEQDPLYGWGSFYTNALGKTLKLSQEPLTVPAGTTRFFVAFYDEAAGEYDDSVAVTLP